MTDNDSIVTRENNSQDQSGPGCSVDSKKFSKARGIPKSREVFRFMKGVTVSTDGAQWILIDGGSRSYYTNLDVLFMKVISLHLHQMKKPEVDMVKNFVELLKHGWLECKALAKTIESSANIVMTDTRTSHLEGSTDD